MRQLIVVLLLSILMVILLLPSILLPLPFTLLLWLAMRMDTMGSWPSRN